MTVLHPQSTRYVPISIIADAEISAVHCAFVPAGTLLPDNPTWVPAELTTSGAQIMIGPNGGHVLGLGWWDVYVKIDASPELPWEYSGEIGIKTDIRRVG